MITYQYELKDALQRLVTDAERLKIPTRTAAHFFFRGAMATANSPQRDDIKAELLKYLGYDAQTTYNEGTWQLIDELVR